VKLLGKRVAVGRCGEHTILEARGCGGGPRAGEKEGILDGNLGRTVNKAARPERGMLSKAIQC